MRLFGSGILQVNLEIRVSGVVESWCIFDYVFNVRLIDEGRGQAQD